MSDDGYRLLGVVIVAAIYPFFWLVAVAIPLWFVRRYAPRAEWWLMTPLSKVIARLASSAKEAVHRGLRASREALHR